MLNCCTTGKLINYCNLQRTSFAFLNIRIIIWLSDLLLIPVLLSAQNFPDLKFLHYSVQDGLSSNNTRAVIQDKRGVIWISTADGLNRFDGSGFRVYKHNPADSTSICDNDVRSMCIDHENMLWLCTGNGLSRFNPVTGKSVSYYHKESSGNTLADNFENNPFVDSRGRLWLSGSSGVQLFDYQKNIFTNFTTPALITPGPTYNFNKLGFIREDNHHRLWVSGFFGFYLIDEENKRLIPYYHGRELNTLGSFIDGENEIFFTQWGGGVNKFNTDKHSYSQVHFSDSLDKAILTDIQRWKDRNGTTWYCIASDGSFILYNPADNSFRAYSFDILNPRSIQSIFNQSIFIDHQNRIWIAGDNGVNIIDPELQYFNNHYLYQQLNKNNPSEIGEPRNILESAQGYQLSAWYAKGLFDFDKHWQLKRQIKKVPESATSVFAAAVNGIYKDKKGIVWYSTDSGLVRYQDARYKVFTVPGAISAIHGDYVVRGILQRSDGLFWIAARQNGILLFNPEAGTFDKQYKPGERNLRGEVFNLCFDKKGDLWAGTSKGIFTLNSTTDSFTSVKYRDKEVVSDYGPAFELLCDESNIIWAATRDGIGKIDVNNPAANSLISSTEGLPEIALRRVKEDRAHNLWFQSIHGITRFDKKNSFKLFTYKDGLPDIYNETYTLFDTLSNGDFIAGFNGTITLFDPGKISADTAKPVVVVGDVWIDKEPYEFSPDGNNVVIRLQPGQKLVQVHFSINELTNSSSNKYFYKIPGITGNWIEAPNGNINFSSLPHGNYKLFLKGTGHNNIQSDELVVPLEIKPFWYQTSWFKLLAALMIGALVFGMVFWRIKAIKKESSFRQKIAEIEMQSLRAQMNPHFIFNSLNSIENFIMQNEKRLASDYLNKFARLIRMILDSSRNELVPVVKDMEALQLYIDMELLRYNDKFTYTSVIDPALLNGDYKVPSLLIQPYVENAIIHGLAHTDKEHLLLTVHVDLKGDLIIYTIEDNGIGRTAASEYNLQNKPQHKSVGLKITQDRIDLFNKAHNSSSSIKFTDLYDNNGKPCGTKVEVFVKAI